MNDPIADMLTRIRNASIVKKTEVVLPYSKLKMAIAKILETEGWIQKSEQIKTEKSNFAELKLTLKYLSDGRPAINGLKRISKPSRRVYVKKTNISKVLNNYGIAILSTPDGLMTNREARKRGVGGEIICEIY